MENWVIVPDGVICPILLPNCSVNHRFPSGPAAIPYGDPVVENSVIALGEIGLIRPILFPCFSANQTFPSGPAETSKAQLLVTRGISVIVQPVTTRPN